MNLSSVDWIGLNLLIVIGHLRAYFILLHFYNYPYIVYSAQYAGYTPHFLPLSGGCTQCTVLCTLYTQIVHWVFISFVGGDILHDEGGLSPKVILPYEGSMGHGELF